MSFPITTQAPTGLLTRDPMLPDQAVITQIMPEAPGINTFALEFTDPEIKARYQFKPGQFNMLYLPGIGEVAISISSDPANPTRLLHTIRTAGNVTQHMARLKAGAELGVRGPFGSSWPVAAAAGQNVILVAGGLGLPPLRPVIYHIIQHREAYEHVQVLVGARSPEDLLYPHEYERWRQHDIEVLITVDRADHTWPGRVGVVPMLFYALRPDPHRTLVFTCGPEIMMRFVIYEALARRIPKDRIFVSLERNMKCAVGMCGHCQYGSAFLCQDGPVLKYSQIEGPFNVEDY